MFFLPRYSHSHLRKLHFLSRNTGLDMGSKHLLRPTTPFTPSPLHTFPSSSNIKRFSTYKRLLPAMRSYPNGKLQNHPYLVKTNGAPYRSQSSIPEPVCSDDLEVQRKTLEALRSKLEEMDFEVVNLVPGQQHYHLICPSCKGGGSEEKSLSLFISSDGNSATWNCFRGKCGHSGRTKVLANSKSTYSSSNRHTPEKRVKDITVESLQLEPLCDQITGFLAERLISQETLRRNRIMQKSHFMDGVQKIVIAFTYWRNGVLVNCKYRDINKNFSQEKNCEKILYGLDDVQGVNDIIIVEGEMDKLAMEEAGFRNCVSVPDGAPPSVSAKDVPSEDKDIKYQYLWNCKEYLEKASRIILATDGDAPGQALAEELARRLGRERCWRVEWPKKNDVEHFKDANEVLMYLGPLQLKEVVEKAELYPIRGLFKFTDYSEEINAYYYQTLGHELGVSTGWSSLNQLYNVVPGELTIVTGVPNSGKSEWIDALLCNINESSGWTFALCSMENKVREHARKLLEKRVKKPFFNSSYAGSCERMNVEEFEKGKQWLDDTFHLIRCEDDSLPSIQWVLGLAKAAVLRHGIRGLVIDPYNELDHQRPVSQTETEYVSQMLTKIKRFAQHHACHVWFVAHPRQLHQWDGGPPRLYDISGSAHFINKCDNGIVIHRNRDPEAGPIDRVQVCVRKVRNKVAGTIGDAFLSYNRSTGQFLDIGTR